MTVEALRRILWRVRKNNPGLDTPSYVELRKAVMLECGIHDKTYKCNLKALKRLKWIEFYTRGRFKYTNKDLTDQ